jgi:hypothetical protein
MLEHRIQGTVGVIWGTAKRDVRSAFADHSPQQYFHQAGFANAPLATEQHHLSQPTLALLPAFQEQRYLRVAAHQRCQAGGHPYIQAALGQADPQDAIHRRRGDDAFHDLGAQGCHREISLHQSMGGGTDQYHMRCGQPLDASRYVRRVSQR